MVLRLRKEDPEQPGVHFPHLTYPLQLETLDSAHPSLGAAWKSSSRGVAGPLGCFNSYPRLCGSRQQMCILSEF